MCLDVASVQSEISDLPGVLYRAHVRTKQADACGKGGGVRAAEKPRFSTVLPIYSASLKKHLRQTFV